MAVKMLAEGWTAGIGYTVVYTCVDTHVWGKAMWDGVCRTWNPKCTGFLMSISMLFCWLDWTALPRTTEKFTMSKLFIAEDFISGCTSTV